MNFATEIQFIKSFVHEWQEIPAEKFTFERLGGLTNFIWKVSNSQMIQPSSIIFRKFGNGCSLIDRESENIIFENLSDKGIGPKCYGKTKSVRLEQYFESRELSNQDFKDFSILIGISKNLSLLHKANIHKLDKQPMIKRFLNEMNFEDSFKNLLGNSSLNDNDKSILIEILQLISEEEINFLKSHLPMSEESIVFSHNDLHARNILKLSDEDRLLFIDYEYGAYNYRGYDIANLFIETMIDYDVECEPYFEIKTSLGSTADSLKKFIKLYLFFIHFDGKITFDETRLEDTVYLDQLVETYYDRVKFDSEAFEIWQEVKICLLYANFYWILWSVEKTLKPSNKFNYLMFAYERFKLYKELKSTLY